MLHFRRMSAAEIIAELPRLSAEELAQVQAKLRELVAPARQIPQRPRIHSPRLAHPAQAKDFVKQIDTCSSSGAYQMPQVQIDDQLFQAAQRRAADGGYSSVEAYITDVVVQDLTNADEETPDLDHRFTPQVIAELKQISAKAQAGGATYTSEEIREHFRRKSQAWGEHHSG